MTFFCFVETALTTTPYMQPMDAESVETARFEATSLLRDHRQAYAAHIFSEDRHVATVRADATAA